MIQKIKKGITYIDIFGYPVHLNFDKKGSFYQNSFGGTISLLYFGMIIYLSIQGIFKIKFHLQDTDISYSNSIDLGDLGPVNYNSTDFKFFHWLLKDNLRNNLPWENLTQYLDIYYIE